MSNALSDIITERQRQIEAEGWTPEHDDEHSEGQIASAAACYALAGSMNDWARNLFLGEWHAGKHTRIRSVWPWAWSWWKPKDRRRDLVRAGALIVAEIERIDRATKQDAAVAAEGQDNPSSGCTPSPSDAAGAGEVYWQSALRGPEPVRLEGQTVVLVYRNRDFARAAWKYFTAALTPSKGER